MCCVTLEAVICTVLSSLTTVVSIAKSSLPMFACPVSLGSESEHKVRAIQRLQERHVIVAVSAAQEEVVPMSR
jgi:hypothetical protein